MFNFQPGTEPSSLETSKTEERTKKNLENCFVFSRRSLSLFFGEAEPNRYIFGPYDTDASLMGLSLWGARLGPGVRSRSRVTLSPRSCKDIFCFRKVTRLGKQTKNVGLEVVTQKKWLDAKSKFLSSSQGPKTSIMKAPLKVGCFLF